MYSSPVEISALRNVKACSYVSKATASLAVFLGFAIAPLLTSFRDIFDFPTISVLAKDAQLLPHIIVLSRGIGES